MTKQSKLKQKIRARMARTGENYTTARSHLQKPQAIIGTDRSIIVEGPKIILVEGPQTIQLASGTYEVKAGHSVEIKVPLDDDRYDDQTMRLIRTNMDIGPPHDDFQWPKSGFVDGDEVPATPVRLEDYRTVVNYKAKTIVETLPKGSLPVYDSSHGDAAYWDKGKLFMVADRMPLRPSHKRHVVFPIQEMEETVEDGGLDAAYGRMLGQVQKAWTDFTSLVETMREKSHVSVILALKTTPQTTPDGSTLKFSFGLGAISVPSHNKLSAPWSKDLSETFVSTLFGPDRSDFLLNLDFNVKLSDQADQT